MVALGDDNGSSPDSTARRFPDTHVTDQLRFPRASCLLAERKGNVKHSFSPDGRLVAFWFFRIRNGSIVLLRQNYQCEEEFRTATVIARELFGRWPRLLRRRPRPNFVASADEIVNE